MANVKGKGKGTKAKQISGRVHWATISFQRVLAMTLCIAGAGNDKVDCGAGNDRADGGKWQ